MDRLPGPVAELWEWQFAGSYRRENPDAFFHPTGEHALKVREPYGVWAGITEYEREGMPVASTDLPTAS